MPKSYSDVPIGGRIRVQGQLGHSARSPVIIDAAGVPIWTLNLPDDYLKVSRKLDINQSIINT